MGRTTVARRQKGNISSDQMQRAIDLHTNGLSIRKAAKECAIPYQTLHRYVKKLEKGEMQRLEPNYSVNKIFTHDQEVALQEYIIECADKFFGLTSKECCRIAYQMAELNNIKMPQSWKDNESAGRDWLRGFKKRFPNLSVRKPEACSLARATAFNRNNVKKFFDNLKNVYQRHPCFGDGSRVYNLDETSTTTVQKPQKVLAPKGRNICKVTSGERGVLVTTVCIVSAYGQALPPAMVFPRKNYKPHMIHGAPAGTLGLASPTGWMTADLFVEVMRHFIKYSSATKDNPALLILDNHESHLSLNALDMAKNNGVTVLTLHPHTTAKMQPLDVGLHAPFKVYYNAAVDSFLMRNPGKGMTIYNVAECVGMAYIKAMTPSNIINSFRKCGIFPYNDDIFTETDFLPSEITDRPLENDDDTDVEVEQPGKAMAISVMHDAEVPRNESPSILESVEDSTSHEILPMALKTAAFNAVISHSLRPATIKVTTPVSPKPNSSTPDTLVLSMPITSKVTITETTHSLKTSAASSITSPKVTTQLLSSTKPSTSKVTITKSLTTKSTTHILPTPSTSKATITKSSTMTSTSNFLPTPSCSKSSDFLSPLAFRPPIKAEPRKQEIKRKRGKSIIATDTPEKEALGLKKRKTAVNTSKKVPKSVKKARNDLFKSIKKGKKTVIVLSDSSDDEEFQASGSSSGGEEFISGSDEEQTVLNNTFAPLLREPRVNDYVVIHFKSKHDDVYYVGKLLEHIKDDEECDFFVSYLKLKSKAQQKFVEPVIPDTAGVKRQDIKFILPQPKVEGTNRRVSTFKFGVDMSLLKLRY